MSNTLITPTVIAKVGLVQLENNLVLGNMVNRQYKNEFVKVGNTVNIRKPVKFVTTKSATLTKQDVKESNAAITISTQAHVGWEFSSQDLTLTVEEYSQRYIEPAMITLANTIDGDLASLYRYVYNEVGTPGTTPATFAALAAAAQRLDEEGAPDTNRYCVMNPAGWYAMADGLKGVFNQSMTNDFLRGVKLGSLAGLDLYMDQNIKVHTVGPLGGTPVVAGNQSHTYPQVDPSVGLASAPTLATSGWTAAAAARLKAGDVFTIGTSTATVYAVNPVNKQNTGVARQFTVLDDFSSAADGTGSIKIWPPIITSGPYQNCSVQAANNAAITVVGTADTLYPQNLVFQKDAFALVMVPMELPAGAAFKSRQTDKGISVRVTQDYDITNDTNIIRIDVLYGVACLYPELAVRLTG